MIPTKIKRTGITITEALASIGVAAVGLFAVLAVIPFAAKQTEAGLDLDVSVAVGKNAFQDFDVRGFGEVDNWRLANIGGTRNFDPTDSYWPGKAFVIDPLYLTRNNPIVNQAISVFPYVLYNNDENAVNRVSPPDPRAASVDQCLFALDRINMATRNSPFNRAQAESIFQSINELLYEEPTDNLNPPTQDFKLIDPAVSKYDPTNWLKRQSAGNVSWMAMVVPETSSAAMANPHMYRLYVVVFRGRQLNNRSANATAAVPATGEAVFTGVVQGNGEGGGVVDLTVVNNGALPVPNDPRTNNALVDGDYLSAGDWILLTDYNQVDENGDLNAHGRNWRWYQIQRVDPPSAQEQIDFTTNGTAIRTTLIGPDWTGRDIDQTNEANPPPSDPRNSDFWDVRAIMMSNVVAVYEKTIRIEYDSIWND